MSTINETLYQRILEKGISEKDLELEIKRKAKEFNGFMTREGILFIIAKEYGINPYNKEFYKELDELIDYDEFSIAIAEIKEQMTNIVLTGKITKVFPPHNFIRKDESMGKVGSFILGDPSGRVKIVIWNDMISLLERKFLSEDLIVRVIGGFSKVGINGNMEVHLGNNGRLILDPREINPHLRVQLETLEINNKNLKDSSNSKFQIKDYINKYKFIKTLQGQVEIKEFKEITKKSGEKTFLLKFELSDDSGSIICNVWGMDAVDSLKLLENDSYIILTNLSVIMNTYTQEKELVFTKKSSLKVL